MRILTPVVFRFCIPRPKPSGYPYNPTTLGERIRQHRMDLHLLQREVAKFIDVDETTIYNWENNRVRPSTQNLPVIQQFLSLKGRDKILSI